jgi:hypothetical protein
MVAERYCLLPRPVIPLPTHEPISPAERDVLAYVCAGYSNKEIAFRSSARPSPTGEASGQRLPAEVRPVVADAPDGRATLRHGGQN